MGQGRIRGGGYYGPSSTPGPQQLVQHSDKEAKMCRLANKLTPPMISSESAPGEGR